MYHLAASLGLVKFIQEILKEKERHQLDVNCPNKDGVTPLYLAEVFSFETSDSSYNPWREVATIIKEHGGKMMFPEKDAEYTIIYERLYGWRPNGLELSLRPDVRGFVLGFWSKFQDRQNSLRPCKCSWESSWKNVSVLSSSFDAVIGEIILQIRLLTRKILFVKPPRSEREVYKSFFDDVKKCYRQISQGYSAIYLKRILNTGFLITDTRYGVSKIKARYKKILRISRVIFFYLMRWWHLRMFQETGCLKSVLDEYRPILLDEKKLTQLITGYTRSSLDWVLEVICTLIKFVFDTYMLSDLCNNGILESSYVLHTQYSDFIRNRMGWTADHTNTWPLDFLFKFSLGLYHQYTYLKILSVGLEQGTRLELHSEKFERELRRARKTHRGILCS